MSIMRLLPGDLADRQTIVELKINHCNAEMEDEKVDPLTDNNKTPYGKSITTAERTIAIGRKLVNKGAIDVNPFMDELELIRKELAKKWVQDLIVHNKVEAYDALYTQLEEANSKLWDLEDKIRALKAAPDRYEGQTNWLNVVKDTAFEIVTNNDLRSNLIKQINALWNYTTQEKMY